MTTIPLPFTTPPLSLNSRHHWATKARLARTIRDATNARARVDKVPHYDAATITLHYRPRDKRRRDKDNLYATLKPAIDGLRDAGVIDEDDADRVEPRVQIHPPTPGQPGALWLTLEPLEKP